MRVFNQAGGEEIAFVLKFRRITGQVLELSIDLNRITEGRRWIVLGGNNVPYHFHLDDFLTRQI